MKQTDNNMQERPLILVAELEGPITRGDSAERDRLYRALARRPNFILVYVTHRYLDSARAFQELMHLPQPHVFVTDMGASVAPGRRDRSISVVDKELGRNWPGSSEIITRLDPLDDLMEKHPLEAPRRVSFLTRDGVTTEEVLPKAQKLLDRLDVQVVADDSIHLDVLPGGVTPKRTVDRVLSWIDTDRSWEVLVVAGSRDEMRLVQDDTTAIVVGSPDDDWAKAVSHDENVHMASTDGCAGIHEAIVRLGLIEPTETQQ